MNKQNYDDLQKETEAKSSKREKKKSKKKKVSGAGVKDLQDLIRDKTNK